VVEPPPHVFLDEESGFVLLALPDGSELVDEPPVLDWEEELGNVLLTASGDGTVQVFTRPHRDIARANGRTRTEKLKDALALLEDRAEEATGDDSERRWFDSTRRGFTLGRVSWMTEDASGGPVHLDAAVYRSTMGEGSMITVLRLAPAQEVDAQARDAVFRDLLERVEIRSENGLENMEEWYENRFDWDAPWRYNIFFSVGSSLAFVLVTLALGTWRLKRIDF
jgi:hypothetical protein